MALARVSLTVPTAAVISAEIAHMERIRTRGRTFEAVPVSKVQRDRMLIEPGSGALSWRISDVADGRIAGVLFIRETEEKARLNDGLADILEAGGTQDIYPTLSLSPLLPTPPNAELVDMETDVMLGDWPTNFDLFIVANDEANPESRVQEFAWGEPIVRYFHDVAGGKFDGYL